MAAKILTALSQNLQRENTYSLIPAGFLPVFTTYLMNLERPKNGITLQKLRLSTILKDQDITQAIE